MSARGFLVIGAVWFLAAVAFGIYYGQTSFAIGWVVKDHMSNAVSLTTVYLMFVFTMIFLIGWIVPLGIGIYRILRG